MDELYLTQQEKQNIRDWYFTKYGEEIQVEEIQEMIPIYLQDEEGRIFEVSYRKDGYLIFTEDDLFKIIKRSL